MPDEGLSGTATTAQPAPAAPAEPQAPQAQTPQEVSPAGGRGETVEQLAARLEEQNQFVRDAQDRLARMEHDLALERQVRSNLTAGIEKPEEPVIPQVSDDEFLANPAKATAKMLDGYMAREKAERDREKASQYVDTARRSYETGWSAAVKENPALFRGIESVVSQEVLSNIRDSFRAGQPVDATVLENPRYYLAAATALRIMNGDDLSKLFGQRTTNPMAPVHTETPSAGAPPQAGMTLSPEQEEAIAKAGIKREQFIESLGKIRASDAERKR